MNDRIFKVFLCSTYTDLIEERQAVSDTIKRLQLRHASMEFFGARPERPLEIILEEVRDSDIIIVIIGHRYGTLVPGKKISYTEIEYKEGWKNGKLCLVYFRSDDVPVLPSKIEQNAFAVNALDKFKKLLQKRHLIATFRQAGDLALQVAVDIERALGRTKQEQKQQLTFQPESMDSTLSLLDFLNTPSFLCDTNDRIFNINKTMATALGYSISEMVGKELIKFTDKDYLIRWYKGGISVLVSKGYRFIELPFIEKEGPIRYFELDLREYEVTGRKIIQCIARDVTERKRIEQVLVESEQNFRHIFEELPAVLILLDTKFRISRANKSACSFFENGFDNIIGREIGEIETEQFGTRYLLNTVTNYAKGGPLQRLLHFRRQGGKREKLLVNLGMYQFSKGEEQYYCLIGLAYP